MIYYSWFWGFGRTALADDLQTDDPFTLEPADIVERVVAAGHVPDVMQPRAEPFRTFGRVEEVEREGLTFLVSISRDAEQIGVQEQRDTAYDPVG